MTKPYVIVHMMTSVDGRIDCGMTAQLAGNDEYYSTLSAIDAPTRVTGSSTAAVEMANGRFHSANDAKLGKESFTKNSDAAAYNIIADSKGKTSWGNDAGSSFPHLILVSEDVSQEYLDYLNQNHISWIATGKGHVDIRRAIGILGNEFGVERLAVVGGGKINGGFLAAGVVDEISIVIGPGVDGRTGQPALFDGLQKGSAPIPLKLKSVKSYDDGAVWLRYRVTK